ncbi:Histone chaperone [Fulvia fulva]|uniref:Histone chaperone n=1 Tax=Passalora fulva TaxID=5499 RepID=A0A9Q8PKT7_PASFU|nr:Histone chaperone [Fulvia fulva]KAK4610295.1 Histone chaperone [Fulvia fulva]KAK4610809.1 Histone chaperone [Fulvia fulva]UJO24271.1 Histone chaperone [Fulvia fulva]WPV21921.1 Histone chaperone [Fulvia fulva]WPV36724.1 Histone chaperone [Fulvia fulva]
MAGFTAISQQHVPQQPPPPLQNVRAAFQPDPNLIARIEHAAQQYRGALDALFEDIGRHVLSSRSTLLHNGEAQAAPATKKRKLDRATETKPVASNGTAHNAISSPAMSFECKNVSFAVPARKKLKLQVITDSTDSRKREIRLIDPKTENTEYTLSSSQIDQVFCLPVPEKQQRQWNFCIFPQAGPTTAEGTPCEQMVFTLNETKPDDATSTTREKQEGDTYITVTEPELNQLLQPYGKHVIRPTEDEFASSIPQAHRKDEKAYHVKAHKGTKEGYLFFLPSGIIFGFKKPLSFFPFSSIEAISYTSVLQRTFNLVISATEGLGSESKDTEFSMLDQADFAGIDEYIKKHGLNDASMAAERKAKAYNVNKPKEDANGAVANGGAEEESELHKAEQQLQDEEDDEEEDYEESGGESDGSGDYSDEEEEEYGDEGDEEGAEDAELDEDAQNE